MRQLHKNYTFIILSGFAFFVIEFLLKSFSLNFLQNSSLNPLPWVQLVFRANADMAFSLPLSGSISIFFAILILLGLFQYFTVCSRDGLYGHVWALNFIIWGAISNLFDRISHGFVIDYIEVAYWPTFNLADAAIVLGMISLLVLINKEEKKLHLQASQV